MARIYVTDVVYQSNGAVYTFSDNSVGVAIYKVDKNTKMLKYEGLTGPQLAAVNRFNSEANDNVRNDIRSGGGKGGSSSGGGDATLVGAMQRFAIADGDAYVTDDDWLPCDGTTYLKADYPTLASRLGSLNPGVNDFVDVDNGATTSALTGIAVNTDEDLFIAVGNDATDFIQTSTDGVAWSNGTTGTSTVLYAVAYSPELDLFAACGEGGEILTTTDGSSWQSRTTPTNTSIRDIVAGNIGTVRFIYGAQENIASSTDGITWDDQAGFSGATAVGASDTLWLAGTFGGTLDTSTDAVTWDNRTSNTSSTIRGFAYDGSTYVYVTDGGGIGSSTDGVTWTARTSGTSSDLNQVIASGNGSFVAVGDGGVAVTSTDGTTWESLTSASVVNMFGLTDAPTQGNLYAAGVSGTIEVSSYYGYDTDTQFQTPIEDVSKSPVDATEALYIKAL